MKKCFVITAAIGLSFLLIFNIYKTINASESDAVDFNLPDLKGGNVRLSDYYGKKSVLIDFSTTWCPYCVGIIPELEKIKSDYKDKDVEVMSIYIGENPSAVENFVKKHNIGYKILVDQSGKVASQYRIFGVPTIMIINKEGIIVYKGGFSYKDIKKILDSNM